ncbi:MAG: hypothetical protein RIQ67_1756 [Pseudomonadota bacterium]
MPRAQKRFEHWVFGALIPAIYLVFELGFNNRLVNIAYVPLDPEVLAGLEFWGRILSGVGFGLFVFRLTLRTRIPRLILLSISLATGVLVMWNAQIALSNYLVRSASGEDKLAALALQQIAPRAVAGELKTLKGESIASPEMTVFEMNAMRILFPAASLHIENRSAQLISWAAFPSVGSAVAEEVQFSADEAYRNLVILPIAMGLSILFAVLNLSFLLVFLFYRGLGRYRSILNAGVFSLLTAVSLVAGNRFLRSDGYVGSMKAGIWQEKPLLALLVEWSASATEMWKIPASVVSDTLLVKFDFRKPSFSY